MPNLLPFDVAQIAQRDAALATWAAYRDKADVMDGDRGGMHWKTVEGREYLVRFWSEGGRKKFEVRGRRGPATEAEFARFKARRAELDDFKTVFLPLVERQARLTKAHGLGRLHTIAGDVLRYLDLKVPDVRAVMAGASCLFAYEFMGAHFIPRGAVVKTDLDLWVEGEAEVEKVADALVAVDGSFRAQGLGARRFQNDEGYQVDLMTLDDRMEAWWTLDDAGEHKARARHAFEAPRAPRMALVDRGGKLATVRTLHPHEFSRIKRARAEGDPLRSDEDRRRDSLHAEIADAIAEHVQAAPELRDDLEALGECPDDEDGEPDFGAPMNLRF